MKIERNIRIEGAAGKTILLDIYTDGAKDKKTPILFVHGIRGFKDWGIWDLLARGFAQAGYFFVKFNHSFGGVSPENPSDISDFETFGNNNYSKEIEDWKKMIDWLSANYASILAMEKLTAIGHSRGGGTVLVAAHEDKRIKKVVTWAAVSGLDFLFYPEIMDEWKEKGVFYTLNTRLKVNMPLYYQIYEDYMEAYPRFDLKTICPDIQQPTLLIHCTDDAPVPLTHPYNLHRWLPNAQLHIIEGGDHVFGGTHPYLSEVLPVPAQELLQKTLDFLKSANQ